MKKHIIWVVVYDRNLYNGENKWESTRFEKKVEPQVNQRGYNAEMAKAWYQRNNPDVKVIRVTVEKHEPGTYNEPLGVAIQI